MRSLIRALAFVLAMLPTIASAQLSPFFNNLDILPNGRIKLAPSTNSVPSLIMPSGSQPSTCVDGYMWKTAAGVFVCNGVNVAGPFQTGAAVVAPSVANNLAIYTGTQAVGGLTSGASSVLVTDSGSIPFWSTTLPPGLTIPSFVVGLANFTIATLPTVTSADKGKTAWTTDCLNGSQGLGSGTGCIYTVNDAGAWTANPSIPTLGIVFGPQTLLLGQSAVVQGNSTKVQLSTGSTVTGHCVQFDANGNTQDAGGACTTGGGGGTVTASPQNSVAYFSSVGTTATVSGMSIVNNAVLVTNGSGVPSESTTLPANLTIPTPTISSPSITGAGTYVALTGTGALTTAASTVTTAGLKVPPGTAPTSPVNGDIWTTSTAQFARINGVSTAMLSNITTTAPLTGGNVGPSVTLACPGCALTTNGGLLTATAPITISAAGLIALGTEPFAMTWFADALTTVHNDTYPFIQTWPFTNSGTIDTVTYYTGGTSSPSFSLSIQINGTPVTGCTGITVNSATPATATCSAAKTITSGQKLTAVVSAAAGAPASALIQINAHKPAS